MLTRKQLELLRFIHERLKESGIPPSFDEMKDALDLRSKSGIHRLITALEERGFIRRLPNRARAVEVIRLPDSVAHGVAGRSRGFTPNVIQGNLGRVRANSEDEGGRPVAVRPGRPMMHGRIGHTRVLGLPGNPVSAYVCAFLFLTPLLRRLMGRPDLSPPTESAVLGRELAANDERADYLRAKLERRPDGSFVATAFALQDSSMLAPLAEADCLIIREPYAPAAPAGSRCAIVKLGL